MENKLEQKIMKQVTRVYYLKKVFNPLMFKVYALVVALVGMSSLISLTNVFKNMPSLLEIGKLYTFTSSAIANTEVSVQFVLAIVLIVGVLLIRDTIKNFTHAPGLSAQQM
ncbi:hypothetical protein HQ403_01715 [Candidatus Kaiserbacteria bacterium]|nr:hypothetical protein [Candidatus Kaiserbacteria bacterium]